MEKQTEKAAEQTTLIDPTTNGAAKKNPLEPLKFLAKRDVMVTEVALSLRSEDLKNLAKKNSTEGYSREAHTMLEDAAAIEHRILPQLRAQREMPLVSYDDLEKQVTEAIAGAVRAAFSGLDAKNIDLRKGALDRRADNLKRTLAPRIASFVRDVADAAFKGGLAARNATSEAIAAEHLSALRGGRDD